MDKIFFPFSDYWWFYLGFILFVLIVLALDLGVFHKEAHEVSVKEASIWTSIWISLALLFNLLFYFYLHHRFSTDPSLMTIPGFNAAEQAKTTALEFLAGFVIEKSLAIDNVFIFAVVFSYFSIPRKYQHRILFWGILGALLFRGIFIALGAVLMQYQAVVIFFGLLLIGTGFKMYFSSESQPDLEGNFLIRLLKRIFRVHPHIEGERFFIRKNGFIYVTPLFICLVFIELSDIIFAVDSVPAIFALTKEPLIVFTSNVFAILGLRAMYFMLSGVMDKFSYIKYGLASVLIFVGLKMVWLNKVFGGHFPILWSLAIIFTLIFGSILFSVYMVRRKPVSTKT
jgi:tellurite resistance protein TerC